MILLGVVALSLSALEGAPSVTAQSDMELVEPNAGSWHTWLLESGSELQLDAPPDEAATMAEIEELHSLIASVDEEMRVQIQYWSANVPAYRWNKIASEASISIGRGRMYVYFVSHAAIVAS